MARTRGGENHKAAKATAKKKEQTSTSSRRSLLDEPTEESSMHVEEVEVLTNPPLGGIPQCHYWKLIFCVVLSVFTIVESASIPFFFNALFCTKCIGGKSLSVFVFIVFHQLSRACLVVGPTLGV